MKTFTLETNAETAAYDYLSRLSSDRWAWEYARRNDDLRDDAAHRSDDDISEKKADCADIRILRSRVPQTLAERWGLVFMPDPDLNGFEADAVWSHYVFPDQVEVNCTPFGNHVNKLFHGWHQKLAAGVDEEWFPTL